MKKVNLINWTVLFLLFVFNACEPSKDDVCYSCDAEIDMQIKEDIKKYQKLTREEWKKLPEKFKIPVYRTFSEEQKLLFWQNKYKELINFFEGDTYSQQHITKLYSYTNTHTNFFSDNYMSKKENLQDFQSFTNKWNKEAIDLGWSIQLLYAISASGEEVNDEFLKRLQEIKLSPETKGRKDCDCSKKSDLCDIFSYLHGIVRCRKWKCDKTPAGCGTFFKFPCNGICRGVEIGIDEFR